MYTCDGCVAAVIHQVCCSVLKCVAMSCSVLQCLTVCYGISYTFINTDDGCVDAVAHCVMDVMLLSYPECAAVCCRVLQCVVECCGVLQHVI